MTIPGIVHPFQSQPPDLVSFNFPDDASPQRIGKMAVENLLSRNFMLTEDDDGLHYAEICAADGAIHFTRETRDLNLYYQMKDRYACLQVKD